MNLIAYLIKLGEDLSKPSGWLALGVLVLFIFVVWLKKKKKV
jgi:LPXTG-motif cell wall-anchored protein